jgi:hypothetical protein
MEDLKSIPIVGYDEFLKSKYITWESVGGRIESVPESHFGDCFINYSKDKTRLIFSIRFYDNKTYLVVKFIPKEYKLKIGDSISFLFEGDVLLNFAIVNEPFKSGKYYRDDVSVYTSTQNSFAHYFEVLMPISLNQIEVFAKHNFIKWALNFKSHKIIGGDKWIYKGAVAEKSFFQTALKMFATQFLELLSKEVPEYVEKTEGNINEVCYVYLMHDSVNNFYKIGISNSPEYREKTLQSEKPTIVMLCSKQFPKRKIAEILEKTLHSTYANKRVRGEWFVLEKDDVVDLSSILKE